jgi:hypothetical protein
MAVTEVSSSLAAALTFSVGVLEWAKRKKDESRICELMFCIRSKARFSLYRAQKLRSLEFHVQAITPEHLLLTIANLPSEGPGE